MSCDWLCPDLQKTNGSLCSSANDVERFDEKGHVSVKLLQPFTHEYTFYVAVDRRCNTKGYLLQLNVEVK